MTAVAAAAPTAENPSADLPRLTLKDVHTLNFGPYSLAVNAGECISLEGESGCGKSLLLRAIADLDRHAGEVSLDGQTSQLSAAPQWRKQVALLPAESQWWLDTVGEHFDHTDLPALEALLTELGFDTDTLSWPVSRLSSGQKQRLALARILMNRPRVLLLDEPTSSLDSRTTQWVESMVGRYRQSSGAAVVWVSHDSQQARRVASRHYRIQNGRLISLDTEPSAE